jgi:starch-binding outer membrane protein, SusD/RagB family
MKRKIIASLLFISVLTACNKFLERPPEGQLTELEALKDEASIESFLNGVYTYIGDNDFLGGRVQIVGELLADHYSGDKFTGDYAEIYGRRNSIFGGTRDDLYIKGYRIINSSNIVLQHLDKASSKKAVLEGRAKFFRALAHFELVRLFAQPYGYTASNTHAGIPIKTSPVSVSVLRSSVKEVYDQVIADLKAAETLLPDDDGVNVNKWAAKAYLAKVYFQMNMFADAFNYADQVIKSNKYQLDAGYASRYALGTTKEAIFKIVSKNPGYQPGGELRSRFRSDTQTPTLFFTQEFYNRANSNPADLRKAWYSNTLQAGFLVLTKYNRDNFDIPIVHLTEIKLIRAEAGAEIAASNPAALATAITDINDILTRAYGSTSRNLPANASAGLVISTTRNERELEMVGEGNRINEIKRIGARSGINIDRRGSAWNCNGMILQFPKGEQDANAEFQLNPEGGCF